MVLGIGIDIIEVRRVGKLIEKWGGSFLNRVFLPDEIEYCRKKKYPAQHYAARIAVKEAVLKSLRRRLEREDRLEGHPGQSES